jgi:hypothetical protein
MAMNPFDDMAENFQEKLIHRTPSVGAIVNRLLKVNPELGMQDLAFIIRSSMEVQGGMGSEFSQASFIDEEKALGLARRTLQ